ncbi:MAG: CDP-alcohol phosphatidyltransferase family protein [Mediterranea sp.]|jgi:CDP-diacylglycerol--glycerol-3-phosphate 3-phosphatidyltransferase|nr:CDP-alcohol phosphatidyltransferase family protein [Mediterranea sp.]
MNYRDYLQQLIYRVINPLVRGMIKIGITPNFITTTGFVLNVVAAGMFIYAGVWAEGRGLSMVGWAGAVVLFAGLFDMMDGRVARLSGKSSQFGALYDSVLDRYSELMTLFGICYYLSVKDEFLYAVIAYLALMGSLMVSYVRARAEGLGIECKVGFMQRPERVVLTSLGAVLCGAFGHVTAFDPLLILVVALAVVALFANITAYVRIRHCYKVMKN